MPDRRPASLAVICGPMFAGKTTELQRRIALAQAAGERVLVVKPARDTRYGDHEVVTHTGVRVAARSVGTLDEIADERADLVAIDEIHFFASAAGESELALARASGGSRAQVRKALDNLEMTGRVRRHRSKAGTRIELLKFK